MMKEFLKAIDDISKNYELFVANGGSIHEYNGFKGRALNYAHLASKYKYKNEKDIGNAKKTISEFAEYVGKKIKLKEKSL